MKSSLRLSAGLALALASPSTVRAEEEIPPEITGLRTAAAHFVTAFNEKDAAAIAGLFTKNGEIADTTGNEIIAGREAIQSYYEARFQDDSMPLVAVEVANVRFVAPNLAIEDGTIHLTPPGDTAPERSMTYTATLLKNDQGKWHIASTRDLSDVTEPGGQLTGLAEDIIGDWTTTIDEATVEMSFHWDDTGNFIVGDLLVTAKGADPQSGTMRIGWDGSRKTITWWNFDSDGGFSQGDWTRTARGWHIVTSGSSADGEAVSSSHSITIDGSDSITWITKDRMIDGEILADRNLQITRRTAEAQSDSESAE